MFFGRKSRKELLKEIEKLNEKITYERHCNSLLRAEIEFNTRKLDTLHASCMTSGHSKQDFERAEEFICNEIAKELLPYIKFENYLMPSDTMLETKHIGTIEVVRKN